MNVGPGEIAIIAVFALLIFGPRRLPEMARTVGKALREFRKATSELTEELKSGLDEPPRIPPASPREQQSEEGRPGPRG